MSERSGNNRSKGLGLLSVIQVVFVILKCVNLVAWPWKVVLIPLWVDLAALVLIVLLVLAGAILKKKS